jgi:hypothetical protein
MAYRTGLKPRELRRLNPLHYHLRCFCHTLSETLHMNRHTLPRRLRWAVAAAALIALSAGAAPRHAAPKHAAPPKETATTNDFPTQARVEYVMQCMTERGGQNLNNMYHCVCAVDKIAGLMSYRDYSEALTFTYLFDTPGEKGGEFRDPPKSKELRDKLKAAKKEAEVCFPAKPASVEGEKK